MMCRCVGGGGGLWVEEEDYENGRDYGSDDDDQPAQRLIFRQ